MLSVVLQQLDVIAAASQRRLQYAEMNRRHLRTEDRVILAHFLGKQHAVHIGGNDGALLMLLFLGAQRGNQRADTDTRRSQIVYLVDFQTGINLAGAGQNIIHLVGSNRVQTAAEGI